ncbi:MAG: HAD family phosphatase [Oscillospiraceae bacterium]|nr:HAD family phosphatase [Oscillospiraceae bacterium]
MLCDWKGVIFDFNGTLFFDSDKHVMAWDKLSQKLRGVGISSEELQAHFYGVPNNRAIEYLLQKEYAEEILSHLSKLKEAYYREYCVNDEKNFHLVPGACAFFDQLNEQGIPFAIASASIKENIDFFVESFCLTRWFSPRRIIYDDGSFKNKVEMFHHAAAVIGVPIEECLIFEDSESGIRDALTAGCRNVVVVDSMGVADQYSGKPGIKQIIRDFNEIVVA